MPRELFSTGPPPEPILTASPEGQAPAMGTLDERSTAFTISNNDFDDRDLQMSDRLRQGDRGKNLHPYVQTLSLADLESCVALENAAFLEHERCSRQKFIYRLTTCPELTLGLFSSTTISPSPNTEPSHSAARAPDSSTPTHRALLLAQIIATLTTTPTITDASMDFPSTFPSHPDHVPQSSDASSPQEESSETTIPPPVPAKDGPPTVPPKDHSSVPESVSQNSSSSQIGHQSTGRTLAVHSVAVLPTHQNRSLGRTLLKSYLQRMESANIADQCVLIAHPELVRWYVGLGFIDKGESQVVFGGGGWRDMVYKFTDHGPGS